MALIPWSSHQAAAAGRVEDEPATRAEIEEALRNLIHSAQRTIRVVGDDTIPTAWDRIHKQIDYRLYQWQMAEE